MAFYKFYEFLGVHFIYEKKDAYSYRVSTFLPKVENSKSYPPEILDMVKWFPKSPKI